MLTCRHRGWVHRCLVGVEQLAKHRWRHLAEQWAEKCLRCLAVLATTFTLALVLLAASLTLTVALLAAALTLAMLLARSHRLRCRQDCPDLVLEPAADRRTRHAHISARLHRVPHILEAQAPTQQRGGRKQVPCVSRERR